MLLRRKKENELTALFHEFIDNPLYAFPFLGEGDSQYLEEIHDAISKSREFISSNHERIDEFERKVEDDPNYVDWKLIKKGGEKGFLSFTIPPEFGGYGMRSCPYTFFIEEMSSVSAGVGNIFGAHGLGLTPIFLSPYMLAFSWVIKEVVKQEKSSPVLFAFALTEPTGGSDVQQNEKWLKKAKITTYVEKVKGGYLLTGRKVFTSNGSFAKYITVFAEEERGNPESLMCLLVDTSSSDGFYIERVEDKMGQKTCPATALFFDGVFVPSDMVVLKGGQAPAIVRAILGLTRGPVGGIATGIAKGSMKKALSLLSPEDLEDEFVAQKFSSAFAKLYSARLLWINACVESDFHGVMKISKLPYIKALTYTFSKLEDIAGRKFTSYLGYKLGEKLKSMFLDLVYKNIRKVESMTASAKFYATDISFEVCRTMMEIVGEKAVDKSNSLERFLRDVKLTQIYETANEVNKIILYRNLVGVDHV